MKSRTALVAVAALLSMPLSASGQQPPLAFKDIELGKPLSASPLGGKLNCRYQRNICIYSIKQFTRPEDQATIAGQPIEAMTLDLIDGQVHSMYIFFPEDAFSDVRAAFSEKYKPMECEKFMTQDSYGLPVESERCEYKDAGGILGINKRAGRTSSSLGQNSSSLYIRTHEWEQRRDKERAVAKKDI